LDLTSSRAGRRGDHLTVDDETLHRALAASKTRLGSIAGLLCADRGQIPDLIRADFWNANYGGVVQLDSANAQPDRGSSS
jgi:hypothetical protein